MLAIETTIVLCTLLLSSRLYFIFRWMLVLTVSTFFMLSSLTLVPLVGTLRGKAESHSRQVKHQCSPSYRSKHCLSQRMILRGYMLGKEIAPLALTMSESDSALYRSMGHCSRSWQHSSIIGQGVMWTLCIKSTRTA